MCVVYQQETPDHALSACPHAMANEVRCESQQCRQQIRYERFAVCFHCHLPQEICDRWVRQPHGGFRCTPNGRCQYTATLMFDVVATVLSGEHGFQAWLTEDEGETATQQIMASESEEMRWYGRQVVWGGMESSQFVRQFYRCARVAEEAMVLYDSRDHAITSS